MIEFILRCAIIAGCLFLFMRMTKDKRRMENPWTMLFWGQKRFKRSKDVDVVIKMVDRETKSAVLCIPSLKKYAVLHDAFQNIDQNEDDDELECVAYQYKVGDNTYILESAPTNVSQECVIQSAQKEQSLQKSVETVHVISKFIIIVAAFLSLSNIPLSVVLIAAAVAGYALNVPFADEEEWKRLCELKPRPVMPSADGVTDTMPEGFDEWTDVKKYLYKFDKRYQSDTVNKAEDLIVKDTCLPDKKNQKGQKGQKRENKEKAENQYDDGQLSFYTLEAENFNQAQSAHKCDAEEENGSASQTTIHKNTENVTEAAKSETAESKENRDSEEQKKSKQKNSFSRSFSNKKYKKST